jgi:hypothetical protein
MADPASSNTYCKQILLATSPISYNYFVLKKNRIRNIVRIGVDPIEIIAQKTAVRHIFSAKLS